MKLNKPAIIGGGPSGLAALKWVLDDGSDVTLFEQGKETGGQEPTGKIAIFDRCSSDQ